MGKGKEWCFESLCTFSTKKWIQMSKWQETSDAFPDVLLESIDKTSSDTVRARVYCLNENYKIELFFRGFGGLFCSSVMSKHGRQHPRRLCSFVPLVYSWVYEVRASCLEPVSRASQYCCVARAMAGEQQWQAQSKALYLDGVRVAGWCWLLRW